MALSDYGTFIIAMAYFGEPDSATLKFISDNYQESYTPAALTQFRKRNSIHKNSRAEYVAIRHGLEIVERFTAGETAKEIAEDLGFHPKHVSAAIKRQGKSTERRCTQSFLLTQYRCDMQAFIERGFSCRDAAKWLKEYRDISCSKNVVLEVMKIVTKETEKSKYLTRFFRDIPWLFQMSSQDRTEAINELFKISQAQVTP